MNDKQMPLMQAADIEVRVQSVGKSRNGQVGAVLLLYITARAAMNALDAVYAASGWQRTHELIDGDLFCNIDIWDADKATWIRKQDVGTESNAEKEKGRASDAFKRAAVNVGVGRELYTAPFISVRLNDGEYFTQNKNGKEIYSCSAGVRFRCAHVRYDDRRQIDQLLIVDGNGTQRFRWAAAA